MTGVSTMFDLGPSSSLPIKFEYFIKKLAYTKMTKISEILGEKLVIMGTMHCDFFNANGAATLERE
jgi:hypothetical protein